MGRRGGGGRLTTPGGEDRVARVRAGERRAIASLIRDLDDQRAGATEEVGRLGVDPTQGRRAIVGVTGAPGAGKSTLVDALITAWRAGGMRVGVLTVDPSSPRHGGAILGDRVRMQRHATDEGVFIRSFGTRGASGGLSPAVGAAALVLLAGGFSRVVIETVGVGQNEVEITRAAGATVVVTVPGLGDDIQTMKAGVFEVADILVVNKADRPGAEQAVRELAAMLDLRASAGDLSGAEVPVLSTVATDGTGIPALSDAIQRVLARP